MQCKLTSASLALCSLTCASLILSGCGGSHAKTPGTPSGPSNPTPSPGPAPSSSFSVASIQPAAGATQVALNTKITIVFSGAADAQTVNTTNLQVTNPKPVAGTLSYNSSANTATFTPSTALAASTAYTVKVSGVTSSSGTAMSAPFSSTFTTMASSTGGGGGGGGGGSGPTMQYQAPVFPAGGPVMTLQGQVSIDSNGNVTAKLSGVAANTAYSMQFCTATASTNPDCFAITTVSTDASGNGTAITKFPQPGNWAGEFMFAAGGKTQYETSMVAGANGETYQAVLLPETTTDGGKDTPASTGQDPLTSGSVTYSKGSLVFSVMGASPNTAYETSESETNYLDGSGTYGLGTFTTDSRGNGSFSTQLNGLGGDMFQVLPQKGNGFIGGFTIPK